MEYGLKPLGREKFWLWLMLVPTLIGLIFGVFGSVLAILGLSFTQWDLLTPPKWVGIQNYAALLNDSRLVKALLNTFAFSALYVPGVVIFSLAVAVLLNRKIRGVSIFRTIYFLPTVTSAVATALVWNMIYGKDTGILNYILQTLGLTPVCWLCTNKVLFALVIVNIWGAIGEGMIIFLAGLTAVSKEYYEAATLDGANSSQQFFRITLPLVTPSIFFQLLITTINAFQAYDYVYILTRRNQGDSLFPVIVYSIYRNAWNFFNYGGASAQAIELAVLIFALMAFYFWLERRYVVYE
ncbi:MAG TPA: sugar ABC transporter permease [Anaerolineaceae bacterium]|nr:sugar ABC transporter permease [Anaerolineaceae bacterium]